MFRLIAMNVRRIRRERNEFTFFNIIVIDYLIWSLFSSMSNRINYSFLEFILPLSLYSLVLTICAFYPAFTGSIA